MYGWEAYKMPRRRRLLGGVSLLLLLGGAFLFAGCSDDDDGPSGVDSQTEYPNAVSVQTDPDELEATWTLALPGGGTITSTGDAMMTNMAAGDYTISWAPREGWIAPYPNPETRTIGTLRQIDFLGYYYLAPGSIFIDVMPGNLQAAWILTAADGTTWEGVGDTTLAGLAPGDYEIEWFPVDGWNTPDLPGDEQDQTLVQSLTLTVSGTTIFRGYRQADNSIYVNPLPADLDIPWTLEGRVPGSSEVVLQESGTGTAMLSDRWPAGVGETVSSLDITVIWGDVDDWETPEAGEYEMGRGEYLAVSTTYTAVKGSIEIDAGPGDLDAPWTLSGPDGAMRSGLGDASLEDLAPGDYTITWGDLDAWAAPGDETLAVTGGSATTFTGTYAPSLMIQPRPEGFAAPWTISGSSGFSQNGTGATAFTGLGAGQYTLTWREVEGWTAPAAETVSFGAEGVIVIGEYEQNLMSVFVRPEPVGLGVPWTVTGPGGFSASGSGQGTVVAGSPGIYTIEWGYLAGYTTPGATSQALADGASLSFRGRYFEALSFTSVPRGQYTMGTAINVACRNADEASHLVTLTGDILMQTTEMPIGSFVEILQWAVDHGHARLDGSRIYDTLDNSTIMLVNLDDPGLGIEVRDGVFSTATPDLPVTEISWYAAAAACDWLSLHEGRIRAYNHSDWTCNGGEVYAASGYRLPTESEWEYACRAGSTTAYANTNITGSIEDGDCEPSDPAALDSICWYGVNSGAAKQEIASKSPNGWGLFDMHGNVAEWCNDRYRSNYCGSTSCPRYDPVGPGRGDTRVQRGGHFFSPPLAVRSPARYASEPKNATVTCGFRVVIADR